MGVDKPRGRIPSAWQALLGVWLILTGAAARPAGTEGTAAPSADQQAAAVAGHPDVSYARAFRLSCSPATWQALISRPLLLADLWNAYGYAPAYQVSRRGDQLHVDDPTGLHGEVVTLEAGPRRRRYFVRGRLDHWAVPFFNRGQAVFIVDTRPEGTGVAGELVVHVRAGSAVAGFVVRLGRSVLQKHMANRIGLNLRDANRLFDAIEHQPEAVRAQVGEPLWERLQEALAAP